LEVGSIIVASGFDEYDAHGKKEFGYGVYPNVVTSVEFERILSATGPTGSVVMRPSDGKIPKKIGFIQCVGSRDKVNEYCSSVCCMYATKEAVIAKEHQNDVEATIFYMDIRAYGKGFDQYFERAKGEYGVRYIKSMVSRILEDPATQDVSVVYVDDGGELREETFDMIVLSVGLRPSKTSQSLQTTLGIELKRIRLYQGGAENPSSPPREGIYACAPANPPRNIPRP